MLLKSKDKSKYEKFVLASADCNLWQSWAWGEFQESIGRKVFRFGVEQGSSLVAVAQVVQYDLPLGLKHYYVSRGPLGGSGAERAERAERAEGLGELVDEIIRFARKQGVVFVKVDGIGREQISPKFCVKKADSVQPQHSLVIDLKKSEDEILQLMKQKGRYNIRLSQRKDVKIKCKRENAKGKTSVNEFFSLLKQTTKRDEFRGHGVSYYEKMLEKLGDQAELIMAYYDGKPVAGGIFTFYGKTAVYYYGASSDEYRNVMAPYLVQWKAIQTAKKRGCETYDFLGVAPDNVTNHPWAGVTSFKKKFGGEKTEFSEPFDVVLRPFVYSAYKFLRV